MLQYCRDDSFKETGVPSFNISKLLAVKVLFKEGLLTSYLILSDVIYLYCRGRVFI
jgi:hypothetical protein